MVAFQPSFESDVVDEASNFSVLALLGFFVSLCGVSSIFVPEAAPFSIAGAVMGAFALVRSKAWALSSISKGLGFLAVLIGVFSAGWGLTESKLESDHLSAKAREVAEEYLGFLAENKVELAYRLAQPQNAVLGDEVASTTAITIDETTKKQVGDFVKSGSVGDILRIGTKAKWEYSRIKSIYSAPSGISINVLFLDRRVPNSRTLMVRVLRESARPLNPNEHMWSVPDCGWDQ